MKFTTVFITIAALVGAAAAVAVPDVEFEERATIAFKRDGTICCVQPCQASCLNMSMWATRKIIRPSLLIITFPLSRMYPKTYSKRNANSYPDDPNYLIAALVNSHYLDDQERGHTAKSRVSQTSSMDMTSGLKDYMVKDILTPRRLDTSTLANSNMTAQEALSACNRDWTQ
ncbi:hypothetical protein BGZ63DRAFT_405064 [Mariannaea sp. PMI_226]|nr:hypothetical protein BGZ63DRAFT_405064 [Mariannaea sp. PMI_226]